MKGVNLQRAVGFFTKCVAGRLAAALARRLARPLIAACLAGLATCIGIVVFISVFNIVVLPKPVLQLGPQSHAYYSDNGTLLRYSLASDDRYRSHVTYKQLPQALIDATLTYEDQDFYSHHGIDISAIFRAAYTTYIARNRAVGASTITMQVARLNSGLFTKNIFGKLQQVLMALRLDYHYSKQDILAYYFNSVSYGGNIEGVYAASLIYFNKPPQALNALEAISLSVIPQNPNKRNPVKKTGLNALYQARNTLMTKLAKQQDYQFVSTYKTLPLKVGNPRGLPFLAPHFVQSIQAQPLQPIVHTSLNIHLQKKVEKHVSRYIQHNQEKGIHNTAVLVLNYKTMQVKSMVGSADFFNPTIFGQVNGVLAKRSPGSTLKPFVYAAAIQEGLIHPHTLLKDTRQHYAGFTPNNHDNQFKGALSAKEALITSRNVPAVYLQSQLIQKSQRFYMYQLLKKAGVKNMYPTNFYGLALSLGGIEVTMLELVNMYSILANKGCLHTVGMLKTHPLGRCNRLLTPEASYITLNMLSQTTPLKSTKSAYLNNIPWKTGTSWAFRDAWAVGIAGDYITAVWVGNFNGEGNPAFIGRQAAAPLLFNVLSSLPQKKTAALIRPPTVKTIEVCKSTGNIDTALCPDTVKTDFIPGVSPIKSEAIYRTVYIDQRTGLRACPPYTANTIQKIFAFWPSDIENALRLAGQTITPVPPFSAACQQHAYQQGNAPIIVSPNPRLTYIYEANQHIVFNATADKDATVLYWFINGVFFSQSEVSVPVLWPATIGQHNVVVVDDLGRTQNTVFTVNRSSVY